MEGYIYVKNDAACKALLNEIFTEEFMQQNTNFSEFAAFQFSSAVIVNWESEEMVYAKLLMDNFVKESTKFSTWDEMVMTAADRRYKGQ
ncbi:MAG: hypothetical protein ACK5ML_05015 [Lachnospiraceae bacterium]